VSCEPRNGTLRDHVLTVHAEGEKAWMGEGRPEPLRFDQIYERLHARVHRLALRITGNAQDAEDVVQESFLLTFLHLGSFCGKSRLSTWVSRIAINAALMNIRKRRRNDFSLDEIQERSRGGPKIASSHPSPEQQLLQRECEQILAEELGQLTPLLSEVVDLYYLQEVPARDCARMLDISFTNVKSRILRARRKLRPAIDRHFQGQIVSLRPGCCREHSFQ